MPRKVQVQFLKQQRLPLILTKGHVDSPTVNAWALAGMAMKMISLLAMAGVIGGNFMNCLAQRVKFTHQPELIAYLLITPLLGLGSSLLYFFVQVGAVNQAGATGMLDWNMATILAQTNIGYVTGLRALGFSISLIAWTFLFKRSGTRQASTMAVVVYLIAMVFLGGSFALAGHVSTLALAARIAIVLHVVAVFLWIGSLYPLLRLSTEKDIVKVQDLMKLFGAAALMIVAILLVSGIFLLTRLVPTLSDLLTTPYGQTLLLKLVGAVCLLALAGINKLRLVPRLTVLDSSSLLQTSIRSEITIAAFVLAVTTWLTTAVGPAI